MAKRNALGRGLGALIDDAGQEHIVTASAVNEIDIDKIEANPFQPRTIFKEEALRISKINKRIRHYTTYYSTKY